MSRNAKVVEINLQDAESDDLLQDSIPIKTTFKNKVSEINMNDDSDCEIKIIEISAKNKINRRNTSEILMLSDSDDQHSALKINQKVVKQIVLSDSESDDFLVNKVDGLLKTNQSNRPKPGKAAIEILNMSDSSSPIKSSINTKQKVISNKNLKVGSQDARLKTGKIAFEISNLSDSSSPKKTASKPTLNLDQIRDSESEEDVPITRKKKRDLVDCDSALEESVIKRESKKKKALKSPISVPVSTSIQAENRIRPAIKCPVLTRNIQCNTICTDEPYFNLTKIIFPASSIIPRLQKHSNSKDGQFPIPANSQMQFLSTNVFIN